MNPRQHIFLCNSASNPNGHNGIPTHTLEYREGLQNIKLGLQNFVRHVFHIPDRILDLLEIAAYVHAADRLVSRGDRKAVEYHSWSRSFIFVIRVRDFGFWNRDSIKDKLSAALTFMTGDAEYIFEFQEGHSTPKEGLFDSKEFMLSINDPCKIILFSGGLDSLCGVIDYLSTTRDDAVLVSHRSQPSVGRTQSKLVQALHKRFPKRIKHYPFDCSLKGITAREETQRSRSFLYTSIAFAISYVLKKNDFYVYENGITGINFPRRQDAINARTSRTTHPFTLKQLEEFFSELSDAKVRIHNPLLWNTKTEVLQKIDEHGHSDLVSSSVSCGVVRRAFTSGTHCGVCNQCIDRRFAAYAARLDDKDEATGIYAFDFIRQPIKDTTARNALVDYVRLAKHVYEMDESLFYEEMINELVPLVEALPSTDEETFFNVYSLYKRQGLQINTAIRSIRHKNDDPFSSIEAGSFLDICNNRTYYQGYINTQDLKERLKETQPGLADAKKYESVVRDILSTLFEPDLTNPREQVHTSDNREITDLTFRNAAKEGFWHDIKARHNNLIIIFELKNMTELGNNEFNQIMSRLDDNKGKLGFLVSRSSNKHDAERAYRRLSKDIVILHLVDADLFNMLDFAEHGISPTDYVAEMYRKFIEEA